MLYLKGSFEFFVDKEIPAYLDSITFPKLSEAF